VGGKPDGGVVTAATAWDELVAAALMGTERRPWTGALVAGLLDGVVGTEADLLSVASAVWAYREAGREAPPGPSPHRLPSPADHRPPLPPGAVRSLAAILEDRRFTPLLGEWLSLAARHGGRLPPELVPALLYAGRPTDRDALLLVIGPLASWLAAHNPDWSWANDSDSHHSNRASLLEVDNIEEMVHVWQGPDGERIEAFAALRSSNPDMARQLAERTWAAEPSATRAALVGAFAIGLSMEDEPFLEVRLDDRRRDVRQAAAALLTQLPDSRLAGRMRERASALVSVEGRLRPSLHLAPVVARLATDEALLRDGVEVPVKGRGRARPSPTGLMSPLGQIVAATPLDTWPAHLRRRPDELVKMAVRAEAAELLSGWEAAAAARGDPEWARALLTGRRAMAPRLLGLLPPAEADVIAVDLVGHSPLASLVALIGPPPGAPPGPALATPALAAKLSAPLTGAVLDALGSIVAGGDLNGALPVRDALPSLAMAADPDQAEGADALFEAIEAVAPARRPATRTFWARQITQFLEVLHFRQAMHQEFR
jgi:Family of unknown function (DUF5691)